MPPLAAALRGAQEIGFTVLSISISLIAGLHPHPDDERHRRPPVSRICDHASAAIVISMLVSLSTSPMMCGRLLKDQSHSNYGRLYRWSETFFAWIVSIYRRSLAWVLGIPFRPSPCCC